MEHTSGFKKIRLEIFMLVIELRPRMWPFFIAN